MTYGERMISIKANTANLKLNMAADFFFTHRIKSCADAVYSLLPLVDGTYIAMYECKVLYCIF